MYRLLRELATRRELAGYTTQIGEIMTDHMEEALNTLEAQCRGTSESVRETVSQDGKAREKFISECTSALRQNGLRIEQITEGLRQKLLRYMLGSAAIAAMLSAMVCWAFCRLVG